MALSQSEQDLVDRSMRLDDDVYAVADGDEVLLFTVPIDNPENHIWLSEGSGVELRKLLNLVYPRQPGEEL